MNNIDQVLCFGEVLWDNLPTGPLPGGAPMNVALHLKRFGLKSIIASSVGYDQKGRDLESFLIQSGMDTRLIQVHPSLPTSEVLVKLNEKNNATFEICEPVAWDEIRLTPELAGEVKKSQALVYGSLASRNSFTRNTLNSLLESDLLRIMDVNLRPPFNKREIVIPLLSKADIVKLNDDELVTICGWYNLDGDFNTRSFGLSNLLNLKSLIVTKGEHGACLVHDNKLYYHSGYKVKVADTVGAGDAFLAGFLAAFFDGKDMNTALTEASAIGAFVASKPGATPDYTRQVVIEFIVKQ
jgi:fructokinase